MNNNNFSEAPASVTIRSYDSDGFDVMLTLRSTDTTDLLARTAKALEWLKTNGYTPNRGDRCVTPAATGAAEAGTPVCEYHGPMKASSKAPGTWYCPSKMGDGSYCKSKA
jgi:hypothetical protein